MAQKRTVFVESRKRYRYKDAQIVEYIENFLVLEFKVARISIEEPNEHKIQAVFPGEFPFTLLGLNHVSNGGLCYLPDVKRVPPMRKANILSSLLHEVKYKDQDAIEMFSTTVFVCCSESGQNLFSRMPVFVVKAELQHALVNYASLLSVCSLIPDTEDRFIVTDTKSTEKRFSLHQCGLEFTKASSASVIVK